MSKGRKLHRSIVRQLKKEQETSPLSSPMFIHPIVDQLQQGQRSKFKVLTLLHAASFFPKLLGRKKSYHLSS